MRILYDSKKPEYKTPFGVLAPEEVCVLHIRVPTALETRFIQLVVEAEDGSPEAEFAFAWAGLEIPHILRKVFMLKGRG